MPTNNFNYSYPGLNSGGWGQQQQNPWQWSGGQQSQPGGLFNGSALNSWQQPTEAGNSQAPMSGGTDWGSFFSGLQGLFGGGSGFGGGTWQGYNMPYQTTPETFNSFGPQNPAQRGGENTGLTGNTGFAPASGYTPTTPTTTANPVTDPSLAGYQAWGQSGGAPTLIPLVTARMLYGEAPPGAIGYNPNTGQWE